MDYIREIKTGLLIFYGQSGRNFIFTGKKFFQPEVVPVHRRKESAALIKVWMFTIITTVCIKSLTRI